MNKLLSILLLLLLSCNVDENISNTKSIYDYNEEILGEPINIIISESEKVIYGIKSVVSKDKVLFINGGDSLTGIGFWSDFDMENWKIEKPIGSITKDEE